MWPWGHLAVGYLLYSGTNHLLTGSRPSPRAVFWLAIATQLPDLIDKPLAYWWHFLPEGRTLAHSYVFLGPLCLGVVLATRYLSASDVGAAFSIGVLSHPLADGLGAIHTANWEMLTYLVWPILPAPDYEADSFAHHVDQLMALIETLRSGSVTAAGWEPIVLELSIVAVVLLLWVYDGMPPLLGTWRSILGPSR